MISILNVPSFLRLQKDGWRKCYSKRACNLITARKYLEFGLAVPARGFTSMWILSKMHHCWLHYGERSAHDSYIHRYWGGMGKSFAFSKWLTLQLVTTTITTTPNASQTKRKTKTWRDAFVLFYFRMHNEYWAKIQYPFWVRGHSMRSTLVEVLEMDASRAFRELKLTMPCATVDCWVDCVCDKSTIALLYRRWPFSIDDSHEFLHGLNLAQKMKILYNSNDIVKIW